MWCVDAGYLLSEAGAGKLGTRAGAGDQSAHDLEMGTPGSAASPPHFNLHTTPYHTTFVTSELISDNVQSIPCKCSLLNLSSFIIYLFPATCVN